LPYIRPVLGERPSSVGSGEWSGLADPAPPPQVHLGLRVGGAGLHVVTGEQVPATSPGSLVQIMWNVGCSTGGGGGGWLVVEPAPQAVHR
jgi:hypothetical protein